RRHHRQDGACGHVPQQGTAAVLTTAIDGNRHSPAQAAEPKAGGARLITMTRVALVLVSLALATSTAACPAGAAASGPTASTGPTSAGTSAPASGAPETMCGNHVVADESASGTTVCVAVGGELIVLLHTVAGSTWSEPQLSGSALGAGT